MIRIGIIGATGYGGEELVRILFNRDDCEIKWVSSKTYVDKSFSDVYQGLYKLVDQKCVEQDLEKLVDDVDVVFFATPAGVCANMIDENIINKVKIIDLGADFRFSDLNVYKQWYKQEHGAPSLNDEAVYGLCELKRDEIKKARVIGNPGCYTTCSILSLYPLIKNDLIDSNSIIIDAKSGVSGAGRGAKVDNLYCEVNESIKPYGIGVHRHTPEIEEQLSINEKVTINFSPHLVPMNRGILITAYASLNKGVSVNDVKEAYKIYDNEYFIRMLKEGVYPQTRNVRGSNFVDINYYVDERTNRIVVVGALDNLIKGAAGQAVQNMNILFEIEESKGLKIVPTMI